MQNLSSGVVGVAPEINDRVGAGSDLTRSAESGTVTRIAALDFTKGILVLIMVLYHWLNYFVSGYDWIYKYLRFLPISFTCISGFLISQVYLSKHKAQDLRIPKRLLTRGLKLMAIAALLNLAPRSIHFGVFHVKTDGWSAGQFAWDYFTGANPISFSVLVPIAYVLIVSAGLFFIAKHWRPVYHICCLMLVACSIMCEAKGIQSGYLPTVSIGMLGVSVGHISIDKIERLTAYSRLIFLTYVTYLAAVAFVTDSYLLQMFGVCITLLVIYWCGTRDVEEHTSGRIAILLGQYSLFSYIAQIAILQVLRGSLRGSSVGAGVSALAFASCIGGTILSVVVLRFARRRAPAVDTLYRAIFA